MKTCLCCGTDAVSEAHLCANCGEGSWSDSVVRVPVESEPIENEKPAEPIVSSNEHSFDSSDPETAIEVPAKRRRTR